jgi:predicted DCC family thiol-disulfide oxidoreductase YuxK
MKALYVLYDPYCGFCNYCKNWAEQQPTFFTLRFISNDSREARERFPHIPPNAGDQELFAIDDQGGVYKGTHALIMCLYALREYREWSARLAQPSLFPFARQIFEFISKNRFTYSKWFGFQTERDLVQQACQNPPLPCRSSNCSLRS